MELPINTVMYWALTIALIVIVVGSIYFFSDYIIQFADSLPGLTKKNISVSWDEDYILEYPGMIFYYVEGDDSFYLVYNISVGFNKEGKEEGVRGWMWSKDREKWFIAKNYNVVYESSYNFWASQPLLRSTLNLKEYTEKRLTKENQGFLKKLIGKSPEQGLVLIATRVLQNKEILTVTIRSWKGNEYYEKNDARLLKINGLIDKFNQISRGVVRDENKK